MKFYVVVVFAVAIANCVAHAKREKEFKEFKQMHKKTYKDAKEEAHRLKIFEKNHEIMEAHNKRFESGESTFDMGVNEFFDLTAEEFASVMNGIKAPQEIPAEVETFRAKRQTLPAAVNWTAQGLVTPVLNQGACGCCYAFSAAGALEGQLRKKTGRLVQLSKQNLMDCVYGAAGCDGGWMADTWQYVVNNQGVSTEAGYPYTAVASASCRYNASFRATSALGYRYVQSGSEAALQSAVASVGPVSVAIYASLSSFQLYRSGVYDDPNCPSTKYDHGVLVVGYGTLNGVPYWLVKNSWGTTWGNRGYVLMRRNRNNQCSIATAACYPVL